MATAVGPFMPSEITGSSLSRALRFAIRGCVLGFIAFTSRTALASADGISGYSGRDGSTCSGCHAGGSKPTATLTGPTSLTVGQEGTFTFTLSGGPAVHGGLDVAAQGAGTFVEGVGGQGERIDTDEVVHAAPGNF